MAFEPIYEVAVLDGLQKLCSGQVVAEAKLVPPHGEEITKILGVSAAVDVVATEVFTGEARIKGRVDFRVLYSGAGGDHSLDYRAEFTDKIVNDAITGGRPCVYAKVLDTDIVSASDSEIKLAAVVETEIFGPVSKRVKYLVSGGDEVYAHDKTVSYTKLLCDFEASGNATAEVAIGGNKIECIESRICLSKTLASSDMVVLEGNIVSDIVYGGESGIGHVTATTPFSFEAEANGAVSGASVPASVRLSGVTANVTEGEEHIVELAYEISANGFVIEEQSFRSIVDVFSIKNELNKTAEKVEFVLNKQCVYFGDEADGNVTLDAGLPIVDNIVTPLGSSVLLSNVYATEGKVIIEGLVRSNIIYFSGESNALASVGVELPFSVSKPLDVCEGDMVFATGEVLGITTKIRRGNEIDVRAELGFAVCTGQNCDADVITELGEGAEIVAPKGALSMHIGGKKETLWDIAKVFCIKPETVLEQNPELSFPLGGGERIICFRKDDRQ